MKKALFLIAIVLVIYLNAVVSLKLHRDRESLDQLAKQLKRPEEGLFEVLFCHRIEEDDFQSIFEADLVLVSKTRVIDGFAYQIISEIIPLKEGAYSFHEVGQPIGPGIEIRHLSEVPEGAIHYSRDPSPHDTFTDLYAPTSAQQEAGAPSLQAVISRIRNHKNQE